MRLLYFPDKIYFREFPYFSTCTSERCIKSADMLWQLQNPLRVWFYVREKSPDENRNVLRIGRLIQKSCTFLVYLEIFYLYFSLMYLSTQSNCVTIQIFALDFGTVAGRGHKYKNVECLV